MAALPGRVQDHRVGAFGQLGEDGLHLPLEVLDVGGAADVRHRVVHGGGGLLDGDDAADVGRQGDGEGADARVGVQQQLPAAEMEALTHEVNKLLRLRCVGLKEGGPGYSEAAAGHLLVVVALAGGDRRLDLAEVGMDQHLVGVDAEAYCHLVEARGLLLELG